MVDAELPDASWTLDNTEVTDKLVSRRLIEKQRSDEDRRVFLVGLTASGASLLKKLDEPIQTLHQSLLGHVSRSDLKTLNRILQTAREGVDD